METTESGELEKYRSYIQKRRVAPPADDSGDDGLPDNSLTRIVQAEPAARQESEVPWWEKEAYTLLEQDELLKPPQEFIKPSQSRGEGESHSDTRAASRGRSHDLYRKLYARRGRRNPSYASPYRSYSGSQAQIEDNRATVMAIKLIKQCLACFAILGIIVLMQGRADMQDALDVVRRHVVETHIDPQNLLEDVKSVFNQFVRTLGGSP